MSDQRYDAPDTVAVATSASAVVARSPRVGYVPARANAVRDRIAVALLIVALLLPWNLDFGVGIPGSDGLLVAVVTAVTVLAILAALAPHVGPFKLTAADQDVRRTSRVRLLLCLAYLVVAVGFVVYQLLETWRGGGSGLVPPGIGPGLLLGIGGALLASQPPITSISLQDNGFRRWYVAARVLGGISIALATLSVAFNVYWRLRYLFVTNGDFGGQDVATIVTTLLYGAEAMIALVIASRWLIERTAAARLATSALGASGALAATLVWLLPIGRDVDAFHGIAQNTSTAAVGYEGYLFWAAAAAIVAPTTLYAVFLIKPPTIGAYRSAAEKCLTLIAFWAFAAAALRVVDYLIAWSLNLPHALYDSVAMTVFNLVTGFIARWLQRQLVKGEILPPVIAAFSGLLFVFTVANLAIGVALAPRYAEQSPNGVYGNNLAQQITSTFDVTVCVLSFAVLAAMLFTGPLAGYLVRRRDAPITAAGFPASAIARRPADTRTACTTGRTAENRSAERGFDDGARGSADARSTHCYRRAPHPASRTGIRADDPAVHTAGRRRRDATVGACHRRLAFVVCMTRCGPPPPGIRFSTRCATAR